MMQEVTTNHAVAAQKTGCEGTAPRYNPVKKPIPTPNKGAPTTRYGRSSNWTGSGADSIAANA